MKRNLSQTKAFTMIEVLIVVAIISVLAVSLVVSSQGSLKRNRDAQRKSDVKNLSDALELFNNDYGVYPAADANGRILACPYNSTTRNATVCEWGVSEMSDTDGTVYFKRMPDDPMEAGNYVYSPSVGQDYYILYADFELEDDTDSITLGCSGGSCNGHDYFISSSNAPIGTVGSSPTTTPTTATSTLAPTATPSATPSETIIVNSATGMTCTQLCQSVGYSECVSVGLGSGANDNLGYFYFSGEFDCESAIDSASCDDPMSSVLRHRHFLMCGGNRLNWTNCKCF